MSMYSQNCVAVCRTQSCVNEGVNLDAKIYWRDDKEPVLICGKCNQRITEITKIGSPTEEQ